MQWAARIPGSPIRQTIWAIRQITGGEQRAGDGASCVAYICTKAAAWLTSEIAGMSMDPNQYRLHIPTTT